MRLRRFLRLTAGGIFVPSILADVAHWRIYQAPVGGTHDSNTATESGTTTINNRSDGTDDYKASKFLAADSYTCTSITLRLKKTGSPTFNMKASIWSDGGTTPSSSLGESSAVASSTLTTSDADCTFSGLSVSITNATNYWIVLRDSDGAAYSGTNYVNVSYSAKTGFNTYRSADGSSWTLQGGNVQFRFQL